MNPLTPQSFDRNEYVSHRKIKYGIKMNPSRFQILGEMALKKKGDAFGLPLSLLTPLVVTCQTAQLTRKPNRPKLSLSRAFNRPIATLEFKVQNDISNLINEHAEFEFTI